MISLLERYFPALLSGLVTTLALTTVIWTVGIVGGAIAGGWAAQRGSGPRAALQVVVLALSAIPTLVLLFWFHYPAQKLLGVVVDPFITTCGVLSLVNLAFVADAVRRALEDMPSDWTDTAYVLGLDRATTFRRITLPLAARQLVGPILVIQVNMLHATLFASFISVNELFRVAQRINASEYDPVPVYSLLVLFFLAICVPLHLLAGWGSRRFSRDLALR